MTTQFTLHNGVTIPALGFGTFLLENGEIAYQATRAALELGYRSIDTAAVYGNEESVGRALADSGVPRADVFVTTKLWNSEQGYDTTLRAFDESMKRLGIETLDLYLIHWPGKDRYAETWRAFEKLYAEGRIRAIGVSNFLVHHLETLAATAHVRPMVNQIETHPMLWQAEAIEYCRKNGILIEAWSPLMRGGDALQNPVIVEIAARHGKTPAQVILNWLIGEGIRVLPKSAHRERISENMQLFDFALAANEIAALRGMDAGKRVGPHPDQFLF